MAGFGGCDGNIVLVWWAWSWTIVFGGNFLMEEKLRIEGKKKKEETKKKKKKRKRNRKTKKKKKKKKKRKKLEWICVLCGVLWENAIGNSFTKHLENKNCFHLSDTPLV